MNETLYRWTFNFPKVVRQQNSGAVEDFISSYSTVYLRIQKWKNYWNRYTFAKVIVEINVARFYGPRCIYTENSQEETDVLPVEYTQSHGDRNVNDVEGLERGAWRSIQSPAKTGV